MPTIYCIGLRSRNCDR